MLLPKLGNSEIQLSQAWRHHPEVTLMAIDELLKESPEVLKRSEPEVAAFLLSSFAKWSKDGTTARNEVTGSELKLEDSPGNFTVEKQAKQVVIRVYDRFGTAVAKAIPIATASKPGQPDAAPDSDRGRKREGSPGP